MEHHRAPLGKASLWASIIGIALPLSLSLIAIIYFVCGPGQPRGGGAGPEAQVVVWILISAPVLGVILEAVAFGCGIVARPTATGKAGLAISGIALLLALITALYFSDYLKGALGFPR